MGPVPRRHSWRLWLAGMVTALLLLAPVTLALAAPRLTPIPDAAPVYDLLPLPTPRPNALPTLSGLVDPLPLVVRDLPDDLSRLAGDDYDTASLLDPEDAAAMLDHAWQGLVVDMERGDDLLLYAEYLHFGGGYKIPEEAVMAEPSAEAALPSPS